MAVVPHQRGNRLLAAHCTALDPEALTARQRLGEALGEELAQMLVFALAGGTMRARSAALLSGRAVFAA